MLRARSEFDTIEQAYALARRRLPRSLFEAVFQGNGRGITLRANEAAFDRIMFRSRAATLFESVDLTTTVLGTPISMPVILSSTGSTRAIHPPDGELAVARAAGAAGTIDAVAFRTGRSVAEVAAVRSGPLWQQIYMIYGRAGAEYAIDQAKRHRYEALVVTVDMPVHPGLKPPEVPKIKFASFRLYGAQLAVRPSWTARFLRDAIRPEVRNSEAMFGPASRFYTARWEDFSWIREQWPGPIVVKGIMSAEDARRALDVGAAAIVVSNHGGTGLDGLPATLACLPRVLGVVDGQAEVLLDGGIRRGSDVAKAVALGARAVLIGQVYLAGLAAAGEDGVRRILELIREQLESTLALLGCPSVVALDRSFIDRPD